MCVPSATQPKAALLRGSESLGTRPPRLGVVSAGEVDEYLRGLEEPKRSTLETLRRTIREIVPEAEEVISYRVPAFRVGGKTIAGFAAFKSHLSYLPFSGSVLGQLAAELEGYTTTKSALHFPIVRGAAGVARRPPRAGAQLPLGRARARHRGADGLQARLRRQLTYESCVRFTVR